ncbi:tetratricopeptide repeat protein [Streptomyces parvulus]|uniref:tetratricopeptide repeat protein n=1 Tax=Streptomyces parvulus TaxID=146923 RepID=UPI003692B6C1
MSRLGRDEQREHERAGRSPEPAATPIDVCVPETASGAPTATVDGATVVAAPGEEIQNAVLNRLHRLALAVGRPVLATIHDRRIGYSVPLRVDPDGSSHLAADPVPTAPAREGTPARDRATRVLRSLEGAPESAPASPLPEVSGAGAVPSADSPPTFTLRSLEGAPESAPASPLPEVSGAGAVPSAESPPTFTLRSLPGASVGSAPGTVAPPTGVFGPPPRMDGAGNGAGAVSREPAGPFAGAGFGFGGGPGAGAGREASSAAEEHASGMPVPVPVPVSGMPAGRPSVSGSGSRGAGGPRPLAGHEPVADAGTFADPDPRPTPARGFDAVAEAVLGDGPLTAPGDSTAPALLAEPTARVNEAVKEGRTRDAAHLAEQAVTEASRTLGPEHPEVLRLRELTAYIAYLSGDPDRACVLSLDLARIHRRAGDAEAAYGNVQSAATAWRAVRDPERGMELGRDLVGLWGELAAEDGPAAEDAEQLESARTRMGRLAERARAQAG